MNVYILKLSKIPQSIPTFMAQRDPNSDLLNSSNIKIIGNKTQKPWDSTFELYFFFKSKV